MVNVLYIPVEFLFPADGIATMHLSKACKARADFMPTSLMSADGTAVPISFVPGHTVTNFAVWSTCSMTVTNTLVDITSCGKSFSTNLNGTTILSRDVIRVSGTATPTCHIIGVGRK